MRKTITLALSTLALLAAPLGARAGGLLEVTLGSGLRAGLGSTERIPTTAGLALGYGIPMFKFEVGAFATLGDVKTQVNNQRANKSTWDIRPMVVFSPPVIPFYLRAIASFSDLEQKPVKATFGGALGIGFSLFSVGAFAEAGAVQHRYVVAVPGGGTVVKDGWQVEGRLGVRLGS